MNFKRNSSLAEFTFYSSNSRHSLGVSAWVKLIACSPCGLLKASFKYDEKESTANDSASLKSQFSFCDVEERVYG